MRKAIILTVFILTANLASAQFSEKHYPLFDSLGNIFYIKLSDTATYKRMTPGSKVTLYTESLDSVGYYRYDALSPYRKTLVRRSK